MACVKSVLWPALVSNVVDVSLSGGSLGHWTACNSVKRYCTVPYCDTYLSRICVMFKFIGVISCDLDIYEMYRNPWKIYVIYIHDCIMY